MQLRWWSEPVLGPDQDVFETDVPDRNHAVAMLAYELTEQGATDSFLGEVLTQLVLRNKVYEPEGNGNTFRVTLT